MGISSAHFSFLPESDEEKGVWLSLFPLLRGKGAWLSLALHQGGQSRSLSGEMMSDLFSEIELEAALPSSPPLPSS